MRDARPGTTPKRRVKVTSRPATAPGATARGRAAKERPARQADRTIVAPPMVHGLGVHDIQRVQGIRSATELQRELRRQGYNIAVDGILGPQTARAWQSYRARLNDVAKATKTWADRQAFLASTARQPRLTTPSGPKYGMVPVYGIRGAPGSLQRRKIQDWQGQNADVGDVMLQQAGIYEDIRRTAMSPVLRGVDAAVEGMLPSVSTLARGGKLTPTGVLLDAALWAPPGKLLAPVKMAVRGAKYLRPAERAAFASHPERLRFISLIEQHSKTPKQAETMLRGFDRETLKLARKEGIAPTALLDRAQQAGAHPIPDFPRGVPDAKVFENLRYAKGGDKYDPRKAVQANQKITRKLKGSRKRVVIYGKMTPREALHRIDAVTSSPQEREALMLWYERAHAAFQSEFVDGMKLLRGFAASQANESPTGGMQAVFRILDKIEQRGYAYEGEASAVRASIDKALKSQHVDKGMAAKLHDFTDALEGKATRTWMGNFPHAGRPTPNDVHAIRARGYIDPKLVGRLKENHPNAMYEPGAFENFVIDSGGSARDHQYQRLTEEYQALTDHMNKVRYDGRADWTPARVQALEWSAIQKMHGAMPEDLAAAFAKNTYAVHAPVPASDIARVAADHGADVRAAGEDVAWLTGSPEVARATAKALADLHGQARVMWLSNVNAARHYQITLPRGKVTPAMVDRLEGLGFTHAHATSAEITMFASKQDARNTFQQALEEARSIGGEGGPIQLEAFHGAGSEGAGRAAADAGGAQAATRGGGAPPELVPHGEYARNESGGVAARALEASDAERVQMVASGEKPAAIILNAQDAEAARAQGLLVEHDPIGGKYGGDYYHVARDETSMKALQTGNAALRDGDGAVGDLIFGHLMGYADEDVARYVANKYEVFIPKGVQIRTAAEARAMTAEPDMLYHGTSSRNAERILAEGKINMGDDGRGHVAAWFGEDPATAAFRGDVVIAIPRSMAPDVKSLRLGVAAVDHPVYLARGGVRELTTEEGYKILQQARKESKRPWSLTPKTMEELQGSRIFATADGKAGFVLAHDGELQNVFNNSGTRGLAEDLVNLAVSQGARKLDAFAPLDEYYKKFGFVEVRREPFDPKYADPSMPATEIARAPDVVYMEHPGRLANRIEEMRTNLDAGNIMAPSRRPEGLASGPLMGREDDSEYGLIGDWFMKIRGDRAPEPAPAETLKGFHGGPIQGSEVYLTPSKEYAGAYGDVSEVSFQAEKVLRHKTLQDWMATGEKAVEHFGGPAKADARFKGDPQAMIAQYARDEGYDAIVNEAGVGFNRNIGPAGAPAVDEIVALNPKAIQDAKEAAVSEKAMKGLRGAAATKREEKALRSEEVSRRVGLAEEAMAGVQGLEEKLIAAKTQLQGALPKLQHQGLRGLDEGEVNLLTDIIEAHPDLQFFERLRAMDALRNAWAVGVPPTKSELRLLKRAFGPQITEASFNPTTLQKIRHGAFELMNMPRSLMASFDVSAPFRQGLVAFARHPMLTSKNLGPMLKYFGSEAGYQDLMRGIERRANFELYAKAKLAITDVEHSLSHREEQYMSQLAEKLNIPIGGGHSVGPGHVVRMSGRAYTGFLVKTRADMFDYLLEQAAKSGYDIEDTKLLTDLAAYINAATGRGNLGKLEGAAIALNSTFFSPRLMASRLTFLNPRSYMGLHPFVRRQKLRAAFQLAGAVGAVLWLGQMAGASVGLDPFNADFGKLKFGDTRVDVSGGFSGYVRELGVLGMATAGHDPDRKAQDALVRFFRGKLAPVPSFSADILTHTDYSGYRSPNLTAEVRNLFIPLVVQDTMKVIQNKDSIGKVAATAAASAVGFGVNTYKATPKSKGKSRAEKEADFTAQYTKRFGRPLPAPVQLAQRSKDMYQAAEKRRKDELGVQKLTDEQRTYVKLAVLGSVRPDLRPAIRNFRGMLDQTANPEAQSFIDSWVEENLNWGMLEQFHAMLKEAGG